MAQNRGSAANELPQDLSHRDEHEVGLKVDDY